MATAKELQTPQIIDVQDGTIRVRHPDVSHYLKTTLRDQLNASTAASVVSDNHGYANTNFVILGWPGSPKTEEDQVSGAVTRGQALTLTGNNAFAHGVDTPVIRIYETDIKIYGATDVDGTGKTLIATVAITWDKPWTEFTLATTDTAYAFYGAEFTDNTTDSTVSTYVPSTGQAYNTASKIIHRALKNSNERVKPDSPKEILTYSYLIDSLQEGIDEILEFTIADRAGRRYKVDWPFEFFGTENTSHFIQGLQMEDKYVLSTLTDDLKYTDTPQSILSIKLGNQEPLKKFSITDYDAVQEGRKRTELAADTVVGAATLTVKDATYLSDNGSVVIGSDTITYTSKNDTTGVLSGIPASGTGSITAIWLADRAVWQGFSGGQPRRYAIYNGDLYLDLPLNSTYADYHFKVRGVKKTNRITTLSATVVVPFVRALDKYVEAKIKMAKGEDVDAIMNKFRAIVEENANAEKGMVTDIESYYTFTDVYSHNDASNLYGFEQD